MAEVVQFGPVEENVAQQMANCQNAEEGALAVLCADNHLGYSMPIGGVIAYERHVSPSAVGYDIACGNCAVRTDALAKDVNVAAVMDDVWRILSFGIGRKNAEPVDAPILDEIASCGFGFQRGLAQMAAQQLGTIGSGNHYVDLFEDRDGFLWVGVHFGSRGFGHKTATWALEKAGTKNDAMMAPPVMIPLDSELGQQYLDGMERAGRYAYAGRDWVVDRVVKIIGASVVDRIHNHHNFAWKETHDGREMLVHRKGATPAYPGQRGFVGATMGDEAVILEGVPSETSAASLYSTVHGAGRVMSRTMAAGKMKRVKELRCKNCSLSVDMPPNRTTQTFCECGGVQYSYTSLKQVRPGLVDFDAVQERIKANHIELRGAGADEAPECYKKLTDVLAHHAGTVRIIHHLRPIGVAMAGGDVFDPFKD